MYMLILGLPSKGHIDPGLHLFSEFGCILVESWVVSPSSRHSLPYGSVCRCVLGMWSCTMAPHRGAMLPAERVWKSRGLVEQHIYFLGQKEHNLALGSGGKSWRTGSPPALCDTENVFLNEQIQGFNVEHMGFYGCGPAVLYKEAGRWVQS